MSDILSPTLPKSNASQSSIASSNPASWQHHIRGVPSQETRKTTKRATVTSNQTLRIDLGKNKKATAKNKKSTPIKKSKKTPLKKTPVKKTPVKRVRRNLSFDNKTGAEKSSRTPKKTPIKKDSNLAKVFNKTPKKTPRKGDCFSVLVPETPDKGCKPRRKSDGVQIVKESPNVDAIKQGRTPRSLNASLNLRRKTTFYSGEVSRSIKAAEEQREAQELQNFNHSKLVNQVPMKRLFEYHTEDNEITIKSPFKMPEFASPKRERRRSNSSTKAVVGRSLDFLSPCKERLAPLDSLKRTPPASKEERKSSGSPKETREKGRRSLDFMSPRKTPVSSTTPRRERKCSSKSDIVNSPLKPLETSDTEFSTPEGRQRKRVARFGIGKY